MKKDRDCSMPMGNPYIGPVMPMMPMPYNMPMTMDMSNQPMNTIMSTTSSYTGVDNNSLYNQINALEKRVSNLEAMISNTNYNNSTYQMM